MQNYTPAWFCHLLLSLGQQGEKRKDKFALNIHASGAILVPRAESPPKQREFYPVCLREEGQHKLWKSWELLVGLFTRNLQLLPGGLKVGRHTFCKIRRNQIRPDSQGLQRKVLLAVGGW